MEKTCFKIFFSKYKEVEWLNSMGKQGYLLKKIRDNKYYFDRSNKYTYNYSIEHLDVAVHSNEADEHFTSLKKRGINPIISSNTWIYFCAVNNNIPLTRDICKKNSVVYFWRSLYLLFFSVIGTILCGYHTFATKYITDVGHNGNGRIPLFEKNGTVYNSLNRLFDLISDTYIKLFVNIFGENDAALTLSVVIPITIILTVFFSLNLHEYFVWRTLSNNTKEVTNAK